MSLPWVVAAIALLAFIALVAGQRFGASRPKAEPRRMRQQVVRGDLRQARAPDISSMSPSGARQSASRSHHAVEVERDSRTALQFFAPMGMAAYEMLRAASTRRAGMTRHDRLGLRRAALAARKPTRSCSSIRRTSSV